jgi:hypothetical protein
VAACLHLFVLDRSASVLDSWQEVARAYLQQALSHAPHDALTGLVVFGATPLVERMSAPRRQMETLYSNPDPSGTDIVAALRLASALFPDGYARRIVLLTDGNETTGDAYAAVQVAAVEGVPIDVVLLPTSKKGNDALIETLEAPSQAKVGELYKVRMVVQSQGHAEGAIVLEREGELLKRLPVKLSPGVNLITTTLRADKPGMQRVCAVLEVQPDSDPRNTLGLVLTRVQGKPHVLIAEGKAGISDVLIKALQANSITFTRVGEGNFPAHAEKLLDYDAIVFNDFPATALSPKQMEAIAHAVRDGGVGFVMIGGTHSYQPGGYYGTPIAEILPVDLNLKHRQGGCSKIGVRQLRPHESLPHPCPPRTRGGSCPPPLPSPTSGRGVEFHPRVGGVRRGDKTLPVARVPVRRIFTSVLLSEKLFYSESEYLLMGGMRWRLVFGGAMKGEMELF